MTSWNNKPVRVQARLVPKFVWTTASIDVFVGDRLILRTGGQLKMTGSHTSTFEEGGSVHSAILSWGKGFQNSFPYQLQIDGAAFDAARVTVENWRMKYIPICLLVALQVIILMWAL